MAHGILTPCIPAMWHVALESWQRIHQVTAPCNVISGSRMTCYWIRLNMCHIGILHLVSISTISLQSTYHSAPVCEILSKSDHPRQKKNDVMSIFKMADVSQFGFYGSNNGFFQKPCVTSYRSSIDIIAVKCLIFEKIVFILYFGDRQTDKQTDGQHWYTKPLSLSWTAA